MRKIAILQPEVPHYRTDFFRVLREKLDMMDIYTFKTVEEARREGFHVFQENTIHISNRQVKGILFYSRKPFLGKAYDGLVLMLHFAHVSTWVLLLTKKLHKKKIILWGQGISVKRYLKEIEKPDFRLKWMIRLSDGVLLYTEPEKELWDRYFPGKPIIALNNTLSGVQNIVKYRSMKTKQELKAEYGIKESKVLIFCARFENNYRRTDLLVETIERLDDREFGFIIIGFGKCKPDFSKYKNVYDFGAVYDESKKQDMFTMADIYFQPGWVGLSIVEAMAYGKPVFTFKRTEETKQCVEYCYIRSYVNGIVFANVEECIKRLNSISNEQLDEMGRNARKFVMNKLMPEMMAERAFRIIGAL